MYMSADIAMVALAVNLPYLLIYFFMMFVKKGQPMRKLPL